MAVEFRILPTRPRHGGIASSGRSIWGLIRLAASRSVPSAGSVIQDLTGLPAAFTTNSDVFPLRSIAASYVTDFPFVTCSTVKT